MFLDFVKSCQFKDELKKENDLKTYFSTLWKHKRCKMLWSHCKNIVWSLLAFKSKMFKEGIQFSAFNIFNFFFIFVHAPRPDNLKVWQMQYWWCSVGIWKKIRGISRCQPNTYVFQNVAQELFTLSSFGFFFVSVRQWSSWKILSSGHVPINSCIHKTYVNLVTAHRLSVKPAQVQWVEIIYKRVLLFLSDYYETFT